MYAKITIHFQKIPNFNKKQQKCQLVVCFLYINCYVFYKKKKKIILLGEIQETIRNQMHWFWENNQLNFVKSDAQGISDIRE